MMQAQILEFCFVLFWGGFFWVRVFVTEFEFGIGDEDG